MDIVTEQEEMLQAGGAGPGAERHAPERRRLRLEERLLRAQAKRQQRLEAVVKRAALRHAQVAARASAMRARERGLAEQLARHLSAAEAARCERLAATAARAGQAFARAREAAAERKLQDELEASRRKLQLLQRLERAERARQEGLAAAAAAAGRQTGPEPFLSRQASRRAALRRQGSSRKLQAAWRAFCAERQTTRALAQAFADTGVPFSVPLQQPAVGPQPAPGASQPCGPSAEPTPAGTPDPCGSPTTTVRRHDGRFASAPQSIPQTPHSTPSPSAAGSPTRRPAMPPAAPPTPGLAMPPLRSIAAPPPPAQAAPAEPAGDFERLAAAISSPATLKAAQALLGRLESRLSVKGLCAPASVGGLLRRLFPRAPPGRPLDRYPPRIFLCAYMVLAHPEVVFNARGEREAALAGAAAAMLAAFEALLGRLLEPAPLPHHHPAAPASGDEAGDEAEAAGEGGETEDEGSTAPPQLAAMLQAFDEAWVAYLEQFAAWKSADAAGLEADLIKAAVELESSRLAKLAGAASPGRLRSPEDMQALVEAVDHDLRLITERVGRLGGAQGLARLAAALAAARAAAPQAQPLPPQLQPADLRAEDGADGSSGQAQLARSPSQSPLKKAPRSAGRYTGASSRPGSGPGEGPGGEAAGEAAGGEAAGAPRALCRSSSAASSGAMSVSYSSGGAELAVDVEAGLAAQPNLALAWQLLYDPNWQASRLPTDELEAAWSDALGDSDPLTEPAPALPPPEEAAAGGEAAAAAVAAAQRRIKRIAERAFWDGVQERLAAAAAASGGEAAAAAVGQVAGLLAELGGQLGEALPAGEAGEEAGAEVAARLGHEALAEQLLAPGGCSLNLPALLDLLDWSARLLARWGAPAREAAAAAAQARVRGELAAAAGAPAGLAAGLTRALRLLAVQLRLLRLDAANARLALLAAQLLRGEGAAAYAGSKWEAVLGPAADGELALRLPHARAWLAAASGQLPRVEQLEGLSPGGGAATASLQQQQALPQLRAGLRPPAGGGPPEPQQQRGPQLRCPVEARSWRGLVRLGLVQLVSGEGAVARLPLPEPLRLDAARLHAAQNEFQRLLVTASCLLLCRQAAAAAGQGFDAGAAKARLAVLLADPSARLPDIAAECCRLAYGPAAAAAEGEGGAAAQREQAMQASLQRLLARGSGSLKALTSGLTAALTQLLLRGSEDPGARGAAAAALRRAGAADLAAEAAQLAGALGSVAAVGEAACGAWYQALSADLL